MSNGRLSFRNPTRVELPTTTRDPAFRAPDEDQLIMRGEPGSMRMTLETSSGTTTITEGDVYRWGMKAVPAVMSGGAAMLLSKALGESLRTALITGAAMALVYAGVAWWMRHQRESGEEVDRSALKYVALTTAAGAGAGWLSGGKVGRGALAGALGGGVLVGFYVLAFAGYRQ